MNIYNNIPYTYRLIWTKTGAKYYGVRFSATCNPEDLWVTYFTSSKYVKEYVEQYGEPDIKEIRKTFIGQNRVAEARNWEHKVLKRLKATTRTDYLNRSDGKSIPPMPGALNPMSRPDVKLKYLAVVQSEEHRVKKSKIVQEQVKNGTHHFLGDTVNRNRINAGTHPFVCGDVQGKTSRRRVQEGTHNFLGGKQQRKMVEDGTHPLLGPTSNLNRLKAGTHPSQQKLTCEHCDKTISIGMYKRWHGPNCRQNVSAK